MLKAGVKFNLKERLANLAPKSHQFTFQRFQLPDRPSINDQNKSFRHSVVDRFNNGGGNGKNLTYTPHELMSKIGDLKQIPDPPAFLRDFHEKHTIRIVDLFKTHQNPIEAAGQLSDLRHALVTWTFRLAALENEANLALAVGGSAANGVHTFLTDFDFVVLPHSEEDKEAARNVQNLMSSMLISIGIEADYVMPRHFDFMTFKELEERYLPHTTQDESDPLKLILQRTSVAFFRFLTDVRIIDVSQKNEGQKVERTEYEKKLEDLKDKLIFSVPDYMLSICEDSFKGKSAFAKEPDKKYIFDIKHKPVRLFHYALYATRAKLGIRGSNFFEVLEILEERGFVSAEERARAVKSLRLFLALRHLIGITFEDTMDSTKVTDEVLDGLSKTLSEDRSQLMDVIQSCQEDLVEISSKMFKRLGSDINS